MFSIACQKHLLYLTRLIRMGIVMSQSKIRNIGISDYTKNNSSAQLLKILPKVLPVFVNKLRPKNLNILEKLTFCWGRPRDSSDIEALSGTVIYLKQIFTCRTSDTGTHIYLTQVQKDKNISLLWIAFSSQNNSSDVKMSFEFIPVRKYFLVYICNAFL